MGSQSNYVWNIWHDFEAPSRNIMTILLSAYKILDLLEKISYISYVYLKTDKKIVFLMMYTVRRSVFTKKYLLLPITD